MKPISQRIAIAGACGWHELPIGQVWQYKDSECYAACDPNKPYASQLPDYLTDLNAMHGAEKTVLFKDVDLYLKNAGELEGVCGGNLDALYATAAQRAEAFLRTIGKWEDDK